MPASADTLEPVLEDLRAGTDWHWAFAKHGVEPEEVLGDPDLADQVRRAYQIGTSWLVTQATLRGVLESDALLRATLAARDPRYADPARNVHVGIGLGGDGQPASRSHQIHIELVVANGSGGPLLDDDGRQVYALPPPEAAL